MWRAEVITLWIGDGLTEATANRPKLADDHAVSTWSDVTGQPAANLPTEPPIYVVYIECIDVVLDAIEADAQYFVIWAEEITDALP